MNMDTALEVLVVAPVVFVWVVAIRDGLRRTSGHRRRRRLLVLPLVLVPPLSVPYMLLRPPSAVRRGAPGSDDPRAELVGRLEAAEAG